MSNFIKHKDQDAINLDFVAGFRLVDNTERHFISFWSNDGRAIEAWDFDNKEDAKETYNYLVKGYVDTVDPNLLTNE